MKVKQILFAAFAACLCASCVEDEGNNTLGLINELEIEGIEEEYTKVGYQEKLEIPVTLKGSLLGEDLSGFTFEWFLCNGELTAEAHAHQVISTSKDLDFPVNIKSGNHKLYFRATDKATGMKWEKGTMLHVTSPFVRGFYLWGDKTDGTCGLDFISMIQDKDSVVIADIFTNPTKMKNATNLIFTGTYNDMLTSLWAMSENEYHSIEHKESLSEFGILEDEILDNKLFSSLDVTRPFQLVDIYPHPFDANNTCQSRRCRAILTTGDIFFTGNLYTEELYGNPINRYSQDSKELYQPAPYAFHMNSSYIQSLAYFDKTNHCFTVNNTSSFGVKYTEKCADATETPFCFDQTKYNPVRDLVYGENADNYSYALMNDANGDYFIYKMMVRRYGANGVQKVAANKVDKSVAIDFDKATHYAFFSKQPIILYAVGAHLRAYNYKMNVMKEVYTMKGDGEITYLAMDGASNDTPTDFIFATYSEAEKGVVYKYTLEDNQNEIVVKPHEYKTKSYPWKTNLKVKKIEYRKSSI